MLKASLKRLREVFNTSSLRRMSAGIELFNYFYKKPSLQIFGRVLNMPLPSLANFTCMALTIEQKHLSRDVSRKRFSKSMQHIYRRTPMPKSDFNKVTNQLFFSIWVFFHEHSQFTGQQGKGGGYLYNSSLPLPPLQKHLDISYAPQIAITFRHGCSPVKLLHIF